MEAVHALTGLKIAEFSLIERHYKRMREVKESETLTAVRLQRPADY